MIRKGLGICILLLLVLGCCLGFYAAIPAYAETVDPGMDRRSADPFALKVSKVDQGTELPVGGAEFLVMGEDDTYLKLQQGEPHRWIRAEEEGTVFVTDEEGTFTIEGLQPGVYYLKESKAPNGYEQLLEPVKIDVRAEYASLGGGAHEVIGFTAHCEGGEICSNSTDRWDLVEVRIENAYVSILPATGGMGTTMYYMLGMVVLFAATFAAALIIVARRLRTPQ